MDDNQSCLCPICNETGTNLIFTYTSPPNSEISFLFSSKGNYRREIRQCKRCGHFISLHRMEDDGLYSGGYVDANYFDEEGLLKTYDRIMSLDANKSDNIGRVKNVLEYTHKLFHGKVPPIHSRSVLDVGSGLCVFLSKMKVYEWNCTALDPDYRAAKHAETIVGINSICGDFLSSNNIGTYDLITFNRVLEHVKDPLAMLIKANDCLKTGGIIYIEVPDGEMAVIEGLNREEFTIDHHHIFSFSSIVLMVQNAGFIPLKIERLQEPSTKYTLRVFAINRDKTRVPKI